MIKDRTPEEQAAFDIEEADAFASGFAGEAEATGLEHTPEEKQAPEENLTPIEEAVASEEKPVVTEPTPTDAPKTVLAGLTEEQVTQALARVSQQQSTIDKLGGRIGALMQQVEAMKTAPKTSAEQRTFDLKLEKLGAAFPELAELLREDLQGIGAGSGDAPAASQPEVFTADDVNRIVTEKLTSFQQQQERGLEVRMLSTAHPDWEQTIRTPQFALWRDNVIEDGKALMESENAAFISLRLTQFKDWVKSTSVNTPKPAANQAPQRNQRLANAVLPKGTAAVAPGEVSEDDAFMSGFKKERAKAGY